MVVDGLPNTKVNLSNKSGGGVYWVVGKSDFKENPKPDLDLNLGLCQNSGWYSKTMTPLTMLKQPVSS